MTKLWADHPFNLVATPNKTEGMSDIVFKVASEMAIAHNIMVRNLNAIYLQAEGVKQPKDIADFIIFCQTAYETVHHHHYSEEKWLFPSIEAYTGEEGIMEGNLQQHKAFESGLESFKDYLNGVTPQTYNGKALKKIMDEFAPPLALHLVDEIGTLLALNKYGGDKLGEAWEDLNKKVFEGIDKHRIFPAGFGAHDRTFEDGKHKDFPPVPWFVPYLCKYIFMRRYSGSWRFSPCNVFGIPRELPFAVEEK